MRSPFSKAEWACSKFSINSFAGVINSLNGYSLLASNIAFALPLIIFQRPSLASLSLSAKYVTSNSGQVAKAESAPPIIHVSWLDSTSFVDILLIFLTTAVIL